MRASEQTARALLVQHRQSTFFENIAMAKRIAAHRHRTRLHVLRDRVRNALRDQKLGVPGAAARLAAHRARRAAYRAANP